ncbi:cytochrome P450 [Nonomuraea roseoviolacea subsp. roseoviolacea]|uniref:Cytochrome P450 n=1 Tax=Nonomuraea roseoviolacea subsp. carminata TaxID=160689 RepID=A0ABT1KCQ6_9ACTN|nr:cytochrome P450 [Nonomuraea roseoviolacea]MCP2351797.1 cytochrome P450 [Nonomuraea roseoviolacea subsp. carminata]
MSTDRQTIVIEGYETVRALLADARLSSAPPDGQAGFGGRHMLNTDPPDHTRLRRLAQKAFTARRVAALRPQIQQITDALIAGILPRGEADLVGDVAFPLATTVICELLGVPAADRTTFGDWFTAALTPADAPDADVIVSRALKALNDYIQALVDAKRGSAGSAGDDLLTALVQARDGDDALSEEELVATVFLLLGAGHETTVNLIGNAMLTLLTDPGRLRLLRERPDLLPPAVEELLRLDGPVQHATPRIALQDIAVDGLVIPAGSRVILRIAAANRDPGIFAEPHRLVLDRTGPTHLAFGHGIHHCLGAPLGRLEAHIAIGALLTRLPGLRLSGPAAGLRWKPGDFLRGLTALPVRFTSGLLGPGGGER